jgi:2-keto-4-pentenoate hydratase/2-oxohepta-3-ene-1,7-dioic acid hydratase in catechol pathway
LPNPPQFIGIGLNYGDHAIESGLPIPAAPIAFAFFTSSIIGSGETIVVPPGSMKVDCEAELGVVIGREGRNIPLTSAMVQVAGYVVVNDVSEREIQSADS